MHSRSAVLFTRILITLSVLSPVLGAAGVNPQTVALPIVFEKNQGQVPSPYQFLSHNGSVTTLFSKNGIDVSLPVRSGKAARIGLQFLGTNANVIPRARGHVTSVSNYLIGNDPSRWISGLENYSQIVYASIYPNIDLVFHGSTNEIEHDFRIAAHGNPEIVRFSIEGGRGLKLTAEGSLEISLDGGALSFQKLRAYQLSEGGVEQTVECAFVLDRSGSVRFRLGAFDHERELVIDPVFSFSTYLDGSNSDFITAIAADATGNVYVTGYTYSLDFPIVNGVQTTYNGSPDAFVSKLDPSGQTLLYSTYLGGSSRTYGNGIAVDSAGNIIVEGTSSSNDFPRTGDLPPLTCEGNNDCFFLASLKSDGSDFNYAGLVGGIEGTAAQTGRSGSGVITVGSSGAVYLAGVTDDANFDITPGTLSSTVPGYPYNSTFVLKVDRTGGLVYSTIVPGNLPLSPQNDVNVFVPSGIAVAGNGRATIAGTAGPGLPSTPGVVQATFPNNLNDGNLTAGFVLQLNTTASAIYYATYVPGTDSIGGMAVDVQGNSYLTGGTVESNLPVSNTAYQKTLKSGPNCPCISGFILKLNNAGTSVLAASYLSGTPSAGTAGTTFTGAALDGNSNIFVGGMSGSTDFPLQNPIVSLWEFTTIDQEMVLAEMNPDLSKLLFGSFLSSTNPIYGGTQFSALAVDRQNHLVVAGQTNANDFPTTSGSFQPSPLSPTTYHAVIAKLDMTIPASSVCFDSWDLNFGSVAAKKSATQVLHLTNCGNAPLQVKSIVSSSGTVRASNTCGTVAAGAVCPISVVYSPIDSSATYATLTFNDNAALTPHMVNINGQGIAGQLSPSAAVFDFGHLLVNTTGSLSSLVFWNTGTAPLTIAGASVDGDFTLTENSCKGTLQQGRPCFIGIAFSPSATGIRTGNLTIVSNDPLHPKAGLSLRGIGDSSYAIPIISSVDPPAAAIGNAPINIWVYGDNFYPASVIMVGGKPQPTTYISGTELETTLESTVTGTAAELPLAVANPIPGGGSSIGVPLNLYAVVNINANFIAGAPNSALVFAAVGSEDAIHPNTVVPISPSTATAQAPIPVGNDPHLLAASSDGAYLYVALNLDQAVQRINLRTRKVERTYPFPPNVPCDTCGPLTVVDMKSVPGTPTEVVVAFTNEMALYNDAGLVNDVPSSNHVAPPTFSSFTFNGADASTIYTLPIYNAKTDFFNVLTINAQGLNYVAPSSYGLNNTTGAQVVSDGTLLYTSAGEVWSPATQKQTGTFPVTTYNDKSYPNLFSVIADAKTKHVFVIGDQDYGTSSSSLVLSAYDTSSLRLTGTVAFTRINSAYVSSLVRWGSNGFAFVGPSADGTSGNVYVSKSAIAGAALNNPVPRIDRLSQTSATQGSSAVYLTVNGKGFAENSTVEWNGTALLTAYVSSTVLNTTVPGSELTTVGTAAVTVVTAAPGGGTSPKASFRITAPTPGVSFSSSSLTFPATTVSLKSAAQVLALQNTGTATLDISSITITGTDTPSFHQTNTCGSTLTAGANCTVSLIFQPKAVGSVSATLSFSDNATGSPQSVILTGTGK